jgi:formate-dependent nitrite reductase membrane component NrfD
MTIVKSSIERQFQDSWGGSIAIYLFLGGMGAGAYFVATVASLLPGWEGVSQAALAFSWPTVIVGLLFLMSHLGKPMRSMLAASKVGSSWISRGVMFFSGMIICALIQQFAGLEGTGLTAVAIIGALFALFTMVYTGAMLASAKGYPLWNSSILPVLFLISGTLTGLFETIIAAKFMDVAVSAAQGSSMAIIAAGITVAELLAILFFVHGAYKGVDSKESAQKLIKSGSFVFGDLILGLAVPLLILLAVFFGGGGIGAVLVASVLGIIGGFLLRKGILAAGMAASLNTAGFKFRPVAKVDFQVSEFGRLPPT